VEQLYDVVVRNENTGETVTVCVESPHDGDAQTAALVQLFRRYGWRKAVAFPAVLVPMEESA
jgi:hypothetical protein